MLGYCDGGGGGDNDHDDDDLFLRQVHDSERSGRGVTGGASR